MTIEDMILVWLYLAGLLLMVNVVLDIKNPMVWWRVTLVLLGWPIIVTALLIASPIPLRRDRRGR